MVFVDTVIAYLRVVVLASIVITIVSGESRLQSDKSKAKEKDIINDLNFGENGGYFKTLSDIYRKRQDSYLDILDKTRDKNEKRQFLIDVLNVNPHSALATFVPFLKGKSKNKNRSPQSGRNSLAKSQSEQEGLEDYRICVEDIETFFTAAQSTLVWALRMVDAAGKPGAGLLEQNVRFLGDYDECINTETDQKFGTKYCLTTIVISRINQFNFSTPFGCQIGLCVPDSCDADTLNMALNDLLIARFGNDTILIRKSQCQERRLPLTQDAKGVIAFLGIIGGLLVLGTMYDLLVVQGLWNLMVYGGEGDFLLGSDHHHNSWKKGDSTHRSEYEPLVNHSKDAGTSQGTFGRILLSFSIYHNTSKLLSTTPTSGSIDCINGIRFISMTWVVLGHTIIFGMGMMANVQSYLDLSYGRWTFQVIANALVAVDTFFALSGLLLVYLIMKGLDKTGPSSGFFGQMYFHRFWRLTPPYMLVMMTYIVLNKYLSDGPAWPQDDEGLKECKESWWTNLLYINNFVKVDDMCMGWSWYLANDMQFFIISPLLFLPLYFLETIGLVVPMVFLLANAMTSGILTYMNDLSPVLELVGAGSNDYFKMYYIKPYTRMGAYIVGMVTGYWLYKYDCKARLPKPLVVIAWMLATATALAVQYGMFEHTNGHPVTSEVAALYNSMHRIAWAAAICWVIFACANGYGGFVNTLLSWKALAPLSRLTYCVYLVHPVVITFHFASQRTLINLDNNNVVFSFLGILVMSYMVGYVASMAFEAPMIGLEKAFKKKQA